MSRVTKRDLTLVSKYSMLEAFFLSSFLMHVKYDNQIGMPVCATKFHDTVVAISLCWIQHRCRLHYVTTRPSTPPSLYHSQLPVVTKAPTDWRLWHQRLIIEYALTAAWLFFDQYVSSQKEWGLASVRVSHPIIWDLTSDDYLPGAPSGTSHI